MESKWLPVVFCIAALVAQVHVTTMRAKNTFVVANSVKSRMDSRTVTGKGINAPIELMEMNVKSEISLRYAHTAVVTRVQNPATSAQQATFSIILPDTAFISGFNMDFNGRTYKALVKGKDEAARTYNNAVSHGVTAAHIIARVRDSNQFTVSVNLEPESEAVFNLTYEELLVRRNGLYNHVINLYPGVVVPKMEVTVHIKEYQKISVLRIPELMTGNEIPGIENVTHNFKRHLLTVLKSNGDKEATIIFTPDREEQLRLMKIYADKTKQSTGRKTTGALGQFFVQYDVERAINGELFVYNGYFVHFFMPPDIKPLSKYVVFVLDVSGSMRGRKITQLKGSMFQILDDLKPNDYFNIVKFNSRVMQVNKKLNRRNELSSIASPMNIRKAKFAVSRFSARGGTNIYNALTNAVNMINEELSIANKDKLQPIIIFLTDGHANVGVTDKERIIEDITTKNLAGKKAAIYSLAFGHNADHELLRKLSLRNNGFMRHIYEATDAALQLKYFYSQVSSPLLADAFFHYPTEQIKAGSVTQHKFRTVFMGSELVVAGKVTPDAYSLTLQMTAFCADTTKHGRTRFVVQNEVAVTENTEYLPLERLWAYLTIQQLLDERDAKQHVDNNDPNSPEKRALAIALKYEFVTPLTSLVVVADAEVDGTSHQFGENTTSNLRPIDFQYRFAKIEEKSDSLGNRFNDDIGESESTEEESNSPDSDMIIFDEGLNFPDSDVFGSPFDPTPQIATTESSINDSLSNLYHLEEYSWALSLLNNRTNSLEFLVNGNNITLELSTSSTAPKDIMERVCNQSVSAAKGVAGVCVYLTRCPAARSIAPDLFRDIYCVVDTKYAGVCCPKDKVNSIAL